MAHSAKAIMLTLPILPATQAKDLVLLVIVAAALFNIPKLVYAAYGKWQGRKRGVAHTGPTRAPTLDVEKRGKQIRKPGGIAKMGSFITS